MKLLHPELIQEFFNLHKDKYPDLTVEEFNQICSAPFKMAKKEIESGELKTIRFQFFGTFLVYRKKVEKMKEIFTFETKFTEVMDNYLAKHPKKNEK